MYMKDNKKNVNVLCEGSKGCGTKGRKPTFVQEIWVGNWKSFESRVEEKVLFTLNIRPKQRSCGQIEGVFEGHKQPVSFLSSVSEAPSQPETA